MTIDRKTAKKSYLTIGVTGGIGSGKSTVCSIFSSLGRTTLSADSIAKEITGTDKDIRKKIEQAYGKSVFLSDGSLNRKLLADIVFTSKDQLEILNSIVHPAVFLEINKRLAGLRKDQREPFVLVEAALIFESGMNTRLDYVLHIHVDEKLRIKRVKERDNSTETEVALRMKNQMSEEKKLKEADFVIMNNDTLEKLQQSVKFYDGLFTTLAGQHA